MNRRVECIRKDMAAEEARRYFKYDPETGQIIRLIARGPAKAGDVAFGTENGHGYLCGGHKGFQYMAHRVAWLLMTGDWPPADIDHIDGNGKNNRWENLRAATRTENMCNRRRSRNSSTGYKGVSWHSKKGKFRASIGFGRKVRHVGYFDNPEDAHAAFVEAAKSLHKQFANDGVKCL